MGFVRRLINVTFPRDDVTIEPMATYVFRGIWFVFATVTFFLVLAAAGYEPITVYSKSFTGDTGVLWYERILGSATSRLGLPKTWGCDNAIINVEECSSSFFS